MDKKEILLSLAKAIIEAEEKLEKTRPSDEREWKPWEAEKASTPQDHKKAAKWHAPMADIRLGSTGEANLAAKLAHEKAMKQPSPEATASARAASKRARLMWDPYRYGNWFPTPDANCPDCGGAGVIGPSGYPCWCEK